ncbi:MAG TPA: tetratricopeptide repeat protein [Gemmatimonadales bacterium]|nr:tetratricopeptide repeat protein [Gemmatimonadales bacterium]
MLHDGSRERLPNGGRETPMMDAASIAIAKARALAAAGHHAAVVEYLGAREPSDLQDSPTLALLYGIAQARLGRHELGQQWLQLAQNRARARGEPAIERHALNARGALALVSGRIDEAADYCTQALMAASRDGDHATTARASNNLGVISGMRGRHAEAIASWEIAAAAFHRAGLQSGIAECHHNLANAYRLQGALDRALAEADLAVAAAEAAGDETLFAQTLRGKAEIRVARSEREPARRELDRVLEIRSRLPDPVTQAEDLRVTALVLAAEGQMARAERALREVMARAELHDRPQLLADATRDFAILLHRMQRTAEAQTAARAARAMFARLGAEGEIRNLAAQNWDDGFAAELRGSLKPLHVAQQFADAGRYAELLTYLEQRSKDELEESASLSLLYGIAHSRLGQLEAGQQWAMVAQLRARVLKDRMMEVRALNVCGAIALERGGIDEATYFFSRAQEEATDDNDMAAVGRCSNNLGIIANLQGDYRRAVQAYTRAIGAYEQAHHDRGIAETRHNLGIACREQGQLDRALDIAAKAVAEAERVGDRQLEAQAVAGLAEVRVARGESELAIREVERALLVHRELKDPVREAEDLRILATALALAAREQEAEAMLRDVIDRATQHGRPLLLASAERDLARLLMRMRSIPAAKAMAERARATFRRLGARMEIDRLDTLLEAS